eukprot:9093-Heterococcus_DN1.PRE.1
MQSKLLKQLENVKSAAHLGCQIEQTLRDNEGLLYALISREGPTRLQNRLSELTLEEAFYDLSPDPNVLKNCFFMRSCFHAQIHVRRICWLALLCVGTVYANARKRELKREHHQAKEHDFSGFLQVRIDRLHDNLAKSAQVFGVLVFILICIPVTAFVKSLYKEALQRRMLSNLGSSSADKVDCSVYDAQSACYDN